MMAAIFVKNKGKIQKIQGFWRKKKQQQKNQKKKI